MGGRMGRRALDRMTRALLALALALLVAASWPASPSAQTAVKVAPAPAWVTPRAAAPSAAAPAAGVIGLEMTDVQMQIEPGLIQAYSRTRLRILGPSGVQIAARMATFTWNPAQQDLTVHRVAIERGDDTIDVLERQTFEVLRRETGLESDLLTGALTATLQPDDLRVGDVLDIALTLSLRPALPGAREELIMPLGGGVPVGQVHVDAAWPADMPLQVRATEELPLHITRSGAGNRAALEARDLISPSLPEDAPGRFFRTHLLEISSWTSWSEISRLMAPLYVEAARLEPGSPLAAEVERIRAAEPTTQGRVMAALRLAQDEVRYLALAMGDGGLAPQGAGETWRRRLGDCKAKTALLIALLQALDIPARPLLTTLGGNDGLDLGLPAIAWFDHVLVEAVIDGEPVRLDPTGRGDRRVEGLADPPGPWFLPLETGGADLLRADPRPLGLARIERRIVIDASAGLRVPAQVTGELIFRGGGAVATADSASTVPPGQFDQVLRALWSQELAALEVDAADFRYDPETAEANVAVSGRMRLDWSLGSRATLWLPRAAWGLSRASREAPNENLPVRIGHPERQRNHVRLILPDGGAGFRLAGAVEIDESAGGWRLRRMATLDDGVVTLDNELMSVAVEISAAESAGADAVFERWADRSAVRIEAPADYTLTLDEQAAFAGGEAGLDAAARVERALAFINAGQAEQGIDVLARAAEAFPEDANVWANLAVQRAWAGDLDAARTDLERAEALDPAERIGFHARAILAMRAGDWREVVIELSRSLRQAPEDRWALGQRARAHWRMEAWSPALADARRLRALEPDNPAHTLLEAMLLVASGEGDAGLALIESLDPGLPPDGERSPQLEWLLLWGALAEETMRWDTLAAAVERIRALAPEEPRGLMLEIELRLARDETEAARGVADRLLPLIASDAAMLNNLCWAFARRGLELDLALAACEAAVARQPDSAALLDSLGMVLLHLGRYDEAATAYDRALAAAPLQPTSLYGRGLARRALGRPTAAEADIARAEALDYKAGEAFRPWLDAAARRQPDTHGAE
jgi:tetratricopeptide (TPR) repeat protein